MQIKFAVGHRQPQAANPNMAKMNSINAGRRQSSNPRKLRG